MKFPRPSDKLQQSQGPFLHCCFPVFPLSLKFFSQIYLWLFSFTFRYLCCTCLDHWQTDWTSLLCHEWLSSYTFYLMFNFLQGVSPKALKALLKFADSIQSTVQLHSSREEELLLHVEVWDAGTHASSWQRKTSISEGYCLMRVMMCSLHWAFPMHLWTVGSQNKTYIQHQLKAPAVRYPSD